MLWQPPESGFGRVGEAAAVPGGQTGNVESPAVVRDESVPW